MSDTQLETFKKILMEDWYALAYEGDKCDGYTVLKVIEGEDRRWSKLVEVYVQFPDERIFKWSFDSGLTEYQENEYPWDYSDSGKWDPEPEEMEKYTETVTVTKFRKKG